MTPRKQQIIKFYEDDARRCEEQADDVASNGYHEIAGHFRQKALRIRELCQKLQDDRPLTEIFDVVA